MQVHFYRKLTFGTLVSCLTYAGGLLIEVTTMARFTVYLHVFSKYQPMRPPLNKSSFPTKPEKRVWRNLLAIFLRSCWIWSCNLDSNGSSFWRYLLKLAKLCKHIGRKKKKLLWWNLEIKLLASPNDLVDPLEIKNLIAKIDIIEGFG